MTSSLVLPVRLDASFLSDRESREDDETGAKTGTVAILNWAKGGGLDFRYALLLKSCEQVIRAFRKSDGDKLDHNETLSRLIWRRVKHSRLGLNRDTQPVRSKSFRLWRMVTNGVGQKPHCEYECT